MVRRIGRGQIGAGRVYQVASGHAPALQFLGLTFAGWVSRHQDDLIEYLREENRILRERLGPQPRIVTPDTILRWYRTLIARK